jgi:hypothetical protein
MAILPLWLVRLLITVLILWLGWALIIGPWLYATDTFLHSHYWWMRP